MFREGVALGSADQFADTQWNHHHQMDEMRRELGMEYHQNAPNDTG
jgi:hypothetical protein